MSMMSKQIITHIKGHYGWKNPYQILKEKKSIKEESEDNYRS